MPTYLESTTYEKQWPTTTMRCIHESKSSCWNWRKQKQSINGRCTKNNTRAGGTISRGAVRPSGRAPSGRAPAVRDIRLAPRCMADPNQRQEAVDNSLNLVLLYESCHCGMKSPYNLLPLPLLSRSISKFVQQESTGQKMVACAMVAYRAAAQLV